MYIYTHIGCATNTNSHNAQWSKLPFLCSRKLAKIPRSRITYPIFYQKSSWSSVIRWDLRRKSANWNTRSLIFTIFPYHDLMSDTQLNDYHHGTNIFSIVTYWIYILYFLWLLLNRINNWKKNNDTPKVLYKYIIVIKWTDSWPAVYIFSFLLHGNKENNS